MIFLVTLRWAWVPHFLQCEWPVRPDGHRERFSVPVLECTRAWGILAAWYALLLLLLFFICPLFVAHL